MTCTKKKGSILYHRESNVTFSFTNKKENTINFRSVRAQIVSTFIYLPCCYKDRENFQFISNNCSAYQYFIL
jgi:hypothetical protein